MSRAMKQAAVGGIKPVGDKFAAFFELHAPCHGGDHRRCTVKRHDVMKVVDTYDEAAKMLAAVHRDVGWESEHDA